MRNDIQAELLFQKFYDITPEKTNIFMNRTLIAKVMTDTFLEGMIYASNNKFPIEYLQNIQKQIIKL